MGPLGTPFLFRLHSWMEAALYHLVSKSVRAEDLTPLPAAHIGAPDTLFSTNHPHVPDVVLQLDGTLPTLVNPSSSSSVVTPPLSVTVASTNHRGHGLFAATSLPPQTLVVEYCGELLTNHQADARLAAYDASGVGHALLVVREVFGYDETVVRTNIDATHVGTLARFANHRCHEPSAEWVVYRAPGVPLPRVGCVTVRAVGKGEEITVSYGDSYGDGRDTSAGAPWEAPEGGRLREPCRCDHPRCLGWLPLR